MLLCVEVCDVCLTVTNAGGEVAGICLGGRRSVLASRPWLGGIGGLGFFSVRPCVRCCGFPHEVTLGVSDRALEVIPTVRTSSVAPHLQTEVQLRLVQEL